MKFKEKDLQNIEYFKFLYNDETFRYMYKYLSTISVDDSDVENYMQYFKRCEEFGLSFCLYYMDSLEDSREMVVFSNFEVKEMPESDLIDLTYLGDKWINRYFCKIFREDGYFIFSDNTVYDNSMEDIAYKDICKKVSFFDENKEVKFLMLK